MITRPDDRISRAEGLLRAAGIEGTVRPAGPRGEIAAVEARPSAMPQLRELGEALRGIGFDFVALELADPERMGEGEL